MLTLARPLPIEFGVPSELVVDEVPSKSKDFATVVPGDLSTYVFGPGDEVEYHSDYRASRFAITMMKAGWDCLRHYEILAAGCIPFFVDLESCPSDTMVPLPKTDILEAMRLPGLSRGVIDWSRFREDAYLELAMRLLVHTRRHLTTAAMARRLLDRFEIGSNPKVLVLSGLDEWARAPDYQRCLLVHGLKELLGDSVVDYPKIEHLYAPADGSALHRRGLYGYGFTYAGRLPDLVVDRDDISRRIRRHEFDLVIYGSVHRGMPFLDETRASYTAREIAFVDGEDRHVCKLQSSFGNDARFFLREAPPADRRRVLANATRTLRSLSSRGRHAG